MSDEIRRRRFAFQIIPDVKINWKLIKSVSCFFYLICKEKKTETEFEENYFQVKKYDQRKTKTEQQLSREFR
jgi:hypothetical protein